MGSIVFDNNNFCWISFPNGIQKFDGKNFIIIPVQEGLPDDKLCGLFTGKDGTLFISHSFGISRYDIKKNKFSLVWKFKSQNKLAAKFMGEVEGVIYIYTHSGNITGISSRDFSVVSDYPSGFPDYSEKPDYAPVISKEIIQHKIALLINKSICTWDFEKGIFSFKSPRIDDISIFMLQLKSENEVLFYTYNPLGTIKIYNTTTNIIRLLPIKQAAGVYLSRCGVYYWQQKILLNINNHIYETDTSLQVLKNELVKFQNLPFSDIAGLATLKEDRLGNLFIQTVSNGIRKVLHNNYPIRYFSNNEANENFILSILPDKANNRILAGAASNGILVYDTLQRFVKHILIKKESGALNSPNCILKTPKGNYLVFGSNENNAWEISSDLNLIKKIPFESQLRPDKKKGTEYFGNKVSQNENHAIVQSQNNIYKIDFAGGRISVKEYYTADGYIMSSVFYPPYVITHSNNNLVFLDTASFLQKKKLPFENTGNVRCFAIDAAKKLYIGSNNGIFITDSTGKIIQHLNRKTGLPDDCIYAMSFDESGNLWCSTNKGILKIQRNQPVLQLRKEDGLQENEFNTNSIGRSDDGELFFGGVNGVSSFYQGDISNHSEKPNLLFTTIRANGEDAVRDTAAWEIESITLPYDKNSLSFDFIAMGNNNADQYTYQYRMDGVDKEWMQHNGLQTVRYSLPSGRYTFKIYASRSFDANAKPIKEIRIIIQPPFWKSWWFLSLVLLTFILLLTYFINQNNKRRYEKKLQQLENERQLKQERERISKDLHDSLGVYANAVLYNSELLEKETGEEKRKELIGDLKFVSKDIIVSLRETVWALKKEKYSAEECFVRIRNFIQPLTRYYTSIHFKTQAEAPLSLEFSHTRALNLVRIVQEAVSNSIKHAGPANISVSAEMINNRWQLIVEDDGKGFDYHTMKEDERGNGLNNMEHRSEESGFGLNISSEEKKGTRITITV
jgi:signal transduction histidine kinase